MFSFCLDCFILFILLSRSIEKRNNLKTKRNTNIKEMKMPPKILSNWKRNYSHGDITLISEQTKKSRPTITRALQGKSASPELIKQIDSFYQKRNDLIYGTSKSTVNA